MMKVERGGSKHFHGWTTILKLDAEELQFEWDETTHSLIAFATQPDVYNSATTYKYRFMINLGVLRVAKPDPIFLDISPASGGMSTNQGGRDERKAPQGPVGEQ